jgi:hypothetical protein
MMRLVDKDETTILQSPEELRNRVNITSDFQALQFVRLRTAIEYVTCWNDQILEVQSFDEASAADDSNSEKPKTGKEAQWDIPSGEYAVLSPEAYKLGGFEPARVSKTKKGYKIER